MLNTALGPLALKKPTILASGILGTNASILRRVAAAGAGAVTLKSIGPTKREGHANPTVIANEHYMLNAVGLPSPGYKNMEKEWKELEKFPVPIIASIYGGSIEEFKKITEAVAQKNPAMLELNVGCPNTKSHGMLFCLDEKALHKVVSEVKSAAGKIPVMPKLTPNVPDIKHVAKTCEDAGADAIAAINTVGPGMLIDVNTAKPVLQFKTGGMSGPAVKPIAVRCVYEISEATKLPIQGIGGVTYGEDAVEMMMAGASAVGIGSGVYYRGIEVFGKVNSEIQAFMKSHGYSKIKDMVGAAHE